MSLRRISTAGSSWPAPDGVHAGRIGSPAVHRYDEDTNELARAVLAYAIERVAMDPPPLDRPRTAEELAADAGQTITEDGPRRPRGAAHLRGGARAGHDLGRPPALPVVHPRRALRGRACCSTSSSARRRSTAAAGYEGAGAVFAENQALRWLADLAGLPPEAGGVFVQGGTNGNLSALVAARHAAAERRGGRPARWRVARRRQAHSSVRSSAAVMDVDVLGGADARPAPDRRGAGGGARRHGADDVFAVVATGRHAPTSASSTTSPASPRSPRSAASGCTSTAPTAAAGAGRAVACGTCSTASSAATRSPSTRTSGCSRRSTAARSSTATRCGARRRTRQKAEYLDSLQALRSWNPSDFAVHLTRRARGLPFWFSLATHGTRAYAEAIEQTLAVARAAAAEIARARPSSSWSASPTCRSSRSGGAAGRPPTTRRGRRSCWTTRSASWCPTLGRRRAGDPHRDRQPAHDARRRPAHPGLAAVGRSGAAILSAPPARSTAGASTSAPRIQITPPRP